MHFYFASIVTIFCDCRVRVQQNLSIGFLIANEGISILENCAKCGIPIPERLIRALAQIKGESEKTED